MQVRGIHHVAINVEDLDAALDFYVAKLGFIALPRPEFGFRGAWLDTGNGQQVHLMEAPAETRSPRQHWAFEVDDLEVAIAELERVGTSFRRGTRFVGAGRQVFVLDPSGNLIEFNQPD